MKALSLTRQGERERIMDRKFSNIRSGKKCFHPAIATGIDQEMIDRIRQRGRAERARIIRQWFLALGRLFAGKRSAGCRACIGE